MQDRSTYWSMMQVVSMNPDGSGIVPRHVVLSLAILAVVFPAPLPAFRLDDAPRESD